jgi:hypothetical protein
MELNDTSIFFYNQIPNGRTTWSCVALGLFLPYPGSVDLCSFVEDVHKVLQYTSQAP